MAAFLGASNEHFLQKTFFVLHISMKDKNNQTILLKTAWIVKLHVFQIEIIDKDMENSNEVWLSQSSIWEGGGHVVGGVYFGRTEWWAAPVSWREWNRPALHHSKGVGPFTTRADEAVLQQPSFRRTKSKDLSSDSLLCPVLCFPLLASSLLSFPMARIPVFWISGCLWLMYCYVPVWSTTGFALTGLITVHNIHTHAHRFTHTQYIASKSIWTLKSHFK